LAIKSLSYQFPSLPCFEFDDAASVSSTSYPSEQYHCLKLNISFLFVLSSTIFYLAFITSLIWFGRQFWHQVVPAPSRSRLQGIEPWSYLPNSASITTEPTKDWLSFTFHLPIFGNLAWLIEIMISSNFFSVTYNCIY
jgi:hypothetical protein